LNSVPDDYLAAVRPPTSPASDRDIADIIKGYGIAAANAMAVGFDAIAIHGAHGYLIDSFLWAATNQRCDAWGGGIRERSSFAVEIVREVRRSVGDDIPILFRFSQWKQQDFRARLATTPGELEAILLPLAEAGVDLFDASQRFFDKPEFDGSPLNLAGWAATVTGKPSMSVGGVGVAAGSPSDRSTPGVPNLERAAQRVANGEFSLLGIGRALLADPEWVAKVSDGRLPVPYHQTMRRRLW